MSAVLSLVRFSFSNAGFLPARDEPTGISSSQSKTDISVNLVISPIICNFYPIAFDRSLPPGGPPFVYTVYSWPDSQTVQVVRRRTGRERPGPCLEIPSDKGILRVYTLCLFHIGAWYIKRWLYGHSLLVFIAL